MADTKKYMIGARPSMRTVTPGAQVTFYFSSTYAQGAYRAAGAASETIRWFRYVDREDAKGDEMPHFKKGPFGYMWEKVPFDILGKHVVACDVKFPGGTKEIYDRTIWVEPTEKALARALFESRKRPLHDPKVAMQTVERYLQLLKKIEKTFPITDAEKKKKHDEKLKNYKTFADALAQRLSSTAGAQRIPVHAIHLEAASQQESRLSVFVAATGWDGDKQVWRLVDWTNPLERDKVADVEGKGATPEEAIRDAFKSWESHNRYYPGTIKWEVPARVCGKAFAGSFQTTGKTWWDSVSEFFGWVALGATILAGIVALVAPVPGSSIISAAIWTSILSSTASSVMNIGQRYEEGFSNYKDDALDGLSIASNLFAGAGVVARAGARAWSKGATVIAKNQKGKLIKGVLIGQVATDSTQAVLIAADHIGQYDKIMSDRSLTPDERAKKLLAFFQSLIKSAGMTYISIKATHKDLQNLNKRPRYVKAPEDAKTPAQKLEELKNPTKTLDVTKVPKVEGHTNQGSQVTKINQRQRRAYKKVQPKKRTKFAEPPPPHNRGIQATHDFMFGEAARQEKVLIIVRDSKAAAVNWMGKKGYKPKPEDLKCKSRKDGPYAGLAAADPGDPQLKKMLQEWVDPATQKKGIEYQDYVKYLDERGYKVGAPPHYLVSNKQTGDKYFSDYDLHGVYKESSPGAFTVDAYSEGFRNRLNGDMGGEYIQHPPHDNWPKRELAEAGPNKGPQPPCTAYLPDGSKVHLKNIGEMKAFYKEHSIPWNDIYTEKYRDGYPPLL